MKKLLAMTILSIVVFTMSAGAEPILLRYKYSMDDQLLYVMNATGEGTVKMTVISGDVDRSKVPGEIPVEMAMQMAMESLVTSVNEEGDATLETKIHRYALKQNGQDVVSYDDSVKNDEAANPMMDMFDENFSMVISTRGEVKEFIGMEALKKLNPQMDLSQMMTQFQQPFPENPVSVGEKWKQSGPMNFGADGAPDMSVETEYEFLGFEEIKGYNCAKIDMKISGDFSEMMKDMFTGMMESLGGRMEHLELETTGTMYFEPDAGVLVAAKFNVVQKMIMTIKPPDAKDVAMQMVMDMDMEGVYELE